MRTRVTVEFEDAKEAERFVTAANDGYIYEPYDDRPLNNSMELVKVEFVGKQEFQDRIKDSIEQNKEVLERLKDQ